MDQLKFVDSTQQIYQLRIKRVVEILKGQEISDDDFVYLDKFVKTYVPEAHKSLTASLTQEAMKKIYQGTQYKEFQAKEKIFTGKDSTKFIVLVLSGKVNIVDEDKENNTTTVLKTYEKEQAISPNDIQSLSQSGNVEVVCEQRSEILIYEKDHYEAVLKEFTSAATNSKLRGVAKNFLKIKKMDRSSKEDFLSYFKQEKFPKGTVMVNIKSKIEEIYLVQSGKVALCVPNENIPSYQHNKIVLGVLGPECLFNEWALLFEKQSPYYAVCVEDTEVLTLNKANLNFVTDADTLNDLRANCQCKQRLQSSFLEKYQKLPVAEVEKSQNKIVEKANIKLKDIMDLFQKFDPKSKNSIQYVKNLEKFNKSIGKPDDGLKKLNTGPLQKFSEFATPRLVSKDPNFRNLDPQRQMALLALRNEGANRRSGNVTQSKNIKDMNQDDIMKMQNRLLNEEKNECEKIIQKKGISDKLNLLKPAAEEEKTDLIEGKKGLFNKMKMDNSQLLANFKFGVGATKEENKEKEPSPTNKEGTPQEEKPSTPMNSLLGQEKPSEPSAPKPSRESLANLLGIGAKPQIRPQSDIINKKRNNLLRNPNLL